MERMTAKRGKDIIYIGRHARLLELGESACSMTAAATRDVLQRLAEYEATGLEPAEVVQLQEQNKPRLIVPVPVVRIKEKDLLRACQRKRRIV